MREQVCAVLVLALLGDWLQTADTRQIRRICKDSEIEILSDQGVRIEPVERSHTELVLALDDIVSKKFQIRFDFKTTGANGILFYGRSRENRKELIAMRLMSGSLYYKIQCPTVAADVLIPFESRLDDGNWHTVSIKFRKGGMKAQVEVDGVKDEKTYEVSCDGMSSLVFGGVSPHDHSVVNSILVSVDSPALAAATG
ncbi:hypothetical protein C0Q70_19647 [Pomacea canaliculata]|uniref:Laminin G domain-containing protein n=1 Tax=Pomacea canaliculata TaxID=400727 RepID=A0A2T7NJY4_POMCA|nr:hypothetical protein C0Q70_19647 [Pomacea canaliculata]